MTLPGAPLIYINDHFTDMCGYTRDEALGHLLLTTYYLLLTTYRCGYTRDEALGHNCRFLQGPETEPEMVASMQVIRV